ncbi:MULTISPECIES: hypothetical protein [unclassified Meiothermus]|uniref:hypothetical protein n=1 Tax=unclassified Meiothermus TaxID=370471 RepID=UPI000D7C6C6D|nr:MULTISPECIES: hypothetical protein [unclassified Meiothermus]PZA07719.1 hypothetical protein DNA98_05240 [Meiothermus sp. Pnk-1]RYM37488.1 hypothetical protein EWH23_06200 [Meiothermus sp. PNK-Is4]
MVQPHLAQEEPATRLLERAENRWALIRDALRNPEDWDDLDWQGEVAELGALYTLLGRVRPSTPEERERWTRLLREIRESAQEFGFNPPPL